MDTPRIPQPSARDLSSPEPMPIPRERHPRRRRNRRLVLENRLSLLCLLLLLLGFSAVTVLLLVLPRSTKSMIEKREFEFPEFSLESYFSGDFTAGIAAYYDDTVPGHDSLKNLGNRFKRLFGLPKSEDSVQFTGNVKPIDKRGPDKPVQAQPTPASAPAKPGNAGPVNPALAGAAGRYMDEPSPTAQPTPEQKIEQADIIENIMVIKRDGHWQGMELFAGGTGDAYVKGLNDLRAQVDPSVQIWSMPAPLPCQFYTPEEYKSYVADQSECFDQVHEKLDSSIQRINVCSALASHADEPIYCRTDHHWQPLGAYYAAQALVNAMDLPFADLSTYTPQSIENCMGTMYSWSKSADLLSDPETFTYYLPGVPYSAVYYDTEFNFQWDDDDLFAAAAPSSDAYMVNLGGDQYIVKTTTEVKNGRTLLVMKDSYGNATIPFYTSSFETIYVADIRYMQRNLVSFIRDLDVTDVVFTLSSFSITGANAECIGDLITQNAGETVTDPHPEPGPVTQPQKKAE